MAENEGFLGRWSRLKREAEVRPVEDTPPPPLEPIPEEAADQTAEAREPLPPVESLGADSDYTRFLAPGVPAELTRLALRKAWVSDPKIAGFRGFAEYDWDCNAPGYGALKATDDIAKLLDKVLGEPEPEPVPMAETEPQEESGDTSLAQREPGRETSEA